MTAILQRLPAAALDLGQEDIATDDPLDIAYLPFEHPTAHGIARREHVVHPKLGNDGGGYAGHAPILPHRG
ncbi:MAG: hypothetical protein R3D85_02555 [Paracoccaceae bacterium]